jgi:hypothetical protein
MIAADIPRSRNFLRILLQALCRKNNASQCHGTVRVGDGRAETKVRARDRSDRD